MSTVDRKKRKKKNTVIFSEEISRVVSLNFKRAVEDAHDGRRYGVISLETENALKAHTLKLNRANKKKR